MSNHALNKNVMARHYDVVILNFNFVIGATGAVLTTKGQVSSVTRTDVGEYEIVLDDTYNRLLYSSAGFVGDDFSGIVAVQIKGAATLQDKIKTGAAYTIQFFDKTGVAADAVAGSVLSAILFVRRTSLTCCGE